MMRLAKVRVALLCTLFMLGLAAAARAEELPMPSDALQSYYQEERRFGAERSEALAQALMLEARTQPAARRLEILEQASLADPFLVDPHLERAGLLLRQGDLAASSVAVGDALTSLRAEPIQQANWLRYASRTFHTLLIVTLGTLAALLLFRSLPFARHLLIARSTIPAPAVLLAAGPVLGAYFFSPVVGVLALLLVLSPLLARRERRVLAALCFALAMAEAGLGLLMPPHAMLLGPSTSSARIARANQSGWDPALEAEVREVPPGRERDLVLGMLASRRGALQTARGHYLASLAADSSWATAYVNLANLFFRSGDYQNAAAGYRSAQTFAPESPYSYGNLARTYIEMMHFSESDREIRRAGELDYDSIKNRRRAWMHEEAPILDMQLTTREILRFARKESREKRGHAALLLQSWRGRAWTRLPIVASPWLFLALAALLASRLRLRAWAFECAACSRVVCTHCTEVPREATRHLCPYCDVTAPRSRGESRAFGRRAIEREEKGRTLVHPPRTADRAPAWATALFPGAADLARGAPLAAAFSALVAWGALFVGVSFARGALQAPEPSIRSANLPLVGAAAVIFVLAYIPGLVRLRRRRRHGGPVIPEGV
jgi:tetratricopeptide (TPR) repeat protein